MRRAAPAFWAIVLDVCLAMGTGSEILEWLYDALSTGNDIKGKADTMSDLLCDAFGAALGGALALHFRWRPRPCPSVVSVLSGSKRKAL